MKGCSALAQEPEKPRRGGRLRGRPMRCLGQDARSLAQMADAASGGESLFHKAFAKFLEGDAFAALVMLGS